MSASSLASLAAASTGDAPEEDEDAGPAPEGSEDEDDADPKAEKGGKPDDDKETGEKKGAEAEAEGDADKPLEAVAASDAVAFGAEQHAAGVAAERARTEKVLSSTEGQANQADAAFLLANTDASADKVIKNLATRKGGSTTTSTSKPAPTKEAEIEGTNVDLGSGVDPAAALGEGAASTGEGGDSEGWDTAIASASYAPGAITPNVAAVPAAAAAAASGGNVTIPAIKTGH